MTPKQHDMKKKLITYLYLLLILIVPASIAAQEASKVRIHGKITDAATKEALPYASIRINKTSIGCSSDNRGNFSFYAPALRDTLIISSVGYTDKRIPLSSKTRNFVILIRPRMRAVLGSVPTVSTKEEGAPSIPSARGRTRLLSSKPRGIWKRRSRTVYIPSRASAFCLTGPMPRNAPTGEFNEKDTSFSPFPCEFSFILPHPPGKIKNFVTNRPFTGEKRVKIKIILPYLFTNPILSAIMIKIEL